MGRDGFTLTKLRHVGDEEKTIIWKADPLDKYPIIVYLEIYGVLFEYISRYTKTSFLIIVYLGIYEYE